MAKKARKTKPKTTKKGNSFALSKQNKIILGSLLMLLSIALFFSFISFYFNWQDDQSLLSEFKDRNEEAKNLLNKFGASVSHFFMYKGFGVATLIVPILFCLSGLYMFLGLPQKGMLKKWIWGLVFMIWISIALGFFAFTQPLLGGLIGFEMNDFLQDYTGKIGVLLLLLFGLIMILVRLFNFSPEAIGNYFETNEFSLESEDTSQEIIDTYTHKEDIPALEPEIKVDELEIKTPIKEEAVEEELAMEVKEVVEEEEEKNLRKTKIEL